MPIIRYKPTSNGRRNSSVQSFADLTVSKPTVKSLLRSRKEHAGRLHGSITVRHRGGGVRQRIRAIDMRMDKYEIPGVVKTIEYDPLRNARIALVAYKDGDRRYVVAPKDLKVGMEIMSSLQRGPIQLGNRYPLELIPPGLNVCLIELQPKAGAKMARSAGSYAVFMGVEGPHAQLRMPSSEVRLVSRTCFATIGQVSNEDFRLVRWGKAGRMRHRGVRPTVRGKVMNPVDHPHGGGEGRNPIGLKHPKTPTGKPALGVKTRRARASGHLILQRRWTKKRSS